MPEGVPDVRVGPNASDHDLLIAVYHAVGTIGDNVRELRQELMTTRNQLAALALSDERSDSRVKALEGTVAVQTARLDAQSTDISNLRKAVDEKLAQLKVLLIIGGPVVAVLTALVIKLIERSVFP